MNVKSDGSCRTIISECGGSAAMPAINGWLFLGITGFTSLLPFIWWTWHGGVPRGLIVFGVLFFALFILAIWVVRETGRARAQRITVDFESRTACFENFRLMRNLRWPSP